MATLANCRSVSTVNTMNKFSKLLIKESAYSFHGWRWELAVKQVWFLLAVKPLPINFFDNIFYFIWSEDVAADYSIRVRDVTDGDGTLKFKILHI